MTHSSLFNVHFSIFNSAVCRTGVGFAMLSVIGACAPGGGKPCLQFRDDQRWNFELASRTGHRVEGEVRMVDSALRIIGTHTPGGIEEPFNLPLENHREWRDSLSFQFANKHYQVRGRCIRQQRIEADYEFLLPTTFRPTHGSGEFRRVPQ